MSHVNLSSRLVPLLTSSSAVMASSLKKILKEQLKNSEGIRGFFVAYLTGEGEDIRVPNILEEAIMECENVEELIELSIMNVIMPTAQACHFSLSLNPETEELEGNATMMKSSLLTAEKGVKV
eukprot:CAMPEP_0182509958 /NCGR_PEP_ID=MMETSP1321-20130603/27770_1 /TAXON_ID=91990 /ORGANISM="Bolidomonas sp., Strain RCC1657" /LENGTH=122 /DNA_ID=CAMNT_0024716341 /DNA_START=170 /DNA_END=535 /DNA_ORIENTATION=+